MKLFLILGLMAIQIKCGQRICKTQVLRSFGLQSRITPTTTNSLCPDVGYNCCTKRDQMKIHKTWNQVNKEYIQSTYRTSRDSFEKLVSILLSKDDYSLKTCVEKFVEAMKPSQPFIDHLNDLVMEYDKKKSRDYSTIVEKVRPKLQALHSDLQKYRQSLFCTLCDWKSHQYFNPQSMTLQYNQPFCLQIVSKHIDMLSDKYKVIFRLLATMDEFLFLISGQRLMEDEDKATFLRYSVIIDKCALDNTKIAACADVCREFNLNKFTYMWDGEPKVVDNFITQYEKLWSVMNDQAKLAKMFIYRPQEWTKEKLTQYQQIESVFSKNIAAIAEQSVRKNTFELNFKASNVKNFFEYRHPTNDVQIETLDEELSSYSLYKMIDPPIDISKFIIIFDPYGGINPAKDSKEMNFEISVDQLLALLHASGTSIASLNEVIDENVSSIMNDLTITDIADFINNPFIEFARIVKPPKKTLQRSLMNAWLFTSFFKLISVLVLMLTVF